MLTLDVMAWDGYEFPQNTLSRAHPGDAGLDICALRDTTLLSERVTLVPTGLTVAIPKGYFGLLTLRSGWACDLNCFMPNGVGIIDSGYRGEIKVPVYHMNYMAIYLHAGERFAQLTIIPFANVAVTFHTTPVTWPDVKATERGTGGFGSSGR